MQLHDTRIECVIWQCNKDPEHQLVVHAYNDITLGPLNIAYKDEWRLISQCPFCIKKLIEDNVGTMSIIRATT